ncbi:MAG: Co2+/Mg2+ efflux protein ApaG [Parvularculaceae bacterium]
MRQITMKYELETRGIKVEVKPNYLEEQSEPIEDHYVWSYTVRIDNNSDEVVKLRTRHWKITNAKGQTEEIRGEGVVGEQPELKPGEGFEYTSGAPLTTPSGFMVGAYGVVTSSGEEFEIGIPAFSLDSPHDFQRLH